MIGDALRTEIEAYAARRHEIPVFRATQQGHITRAMAARYVANVHYMVAITPPYLLRARDRARAIGDEKLAAYYGNKIGEEEGHERWAERDLETLTGTVATQSMFTITRSIRDLSEYLETKIDEDPALYLAYIAFAEYITVIVGPAWLELLEERCGIPRSAMSIIDNHIELDRAHAEEAFACIDDFVSDPRKLAPMREVLAQSIAYFDAFCAEIVAIDEIDQASNEPSVQVSAA